MNGYLNIIETDNMESQTNELRKIISEKTTDELHEILNLNKGEYTEEAIKIAKAELKKRNRGVKKSRKENRVIDYNKKKAFSDGPLCWYHKLCLLFGPVVLIPIFRTQWRVLFWTLTAIIAIALFLKIKGFEKKYKEFWKWIIGGVIIQAAVEISIKLRSMAL